eukprot:15333536-Ditylum_brightwellii.AAC.1
MGFFGRGDDFAQTCREADEANDPAVSSLQSEGQESNANNNKAKKLEPGAGIFLIINLRENIENNLLYRECVDDCDGLGVLNGPPTVSVSFKNVGCASSMVWECNGGHQHVCKSVTRENDPTKGRDGKMHWEKKLSLYENNIKIVLAALTMGVGAEEIKNMLT